MFIKISAYFSWIGTTFCFFLSLPNTVTTNYKSYFLPLQSFKQVSPATVEGMIFFLVRVSLKSFAFLYANSCMQNPQSAIQMWKLILWLESQPSIQAVSSKLAAEEMGERRGVKLPWLQSSPLNCNFPYFSRIQEEGSSTLSDLWLQRGLTQIASSTLLAAHQARCLFCLSFVLWVLIMDMKETAFICTHRFLVE